MPELPEVETVKRAIAEAATDHRIDDVMISGKKMRWPIPDDINNQISGMTINELRRRGKYILMDLNGKKTLKTVIVHLGMSGSIRIYSEGHNIEPKKHDHLSIKTAHTKHGVTIVLNDPRRFGGVQIIETENAKTHPLLKKMGVEPLNEEHNPKMMLAAFKGKTAPIKSVLLDQHIIAGIGNIYASEALFRAGISPKRMAKNISRKKLALLNTEIKNVLTEAIAKGGTSLRDHVQPGGEIGYFVQSLNVYGRKGEPCPHCSTPIKEIRQTGRASFYCSQCQR